MTRSRSAHGYYRAVVLLAAALATADCSPADVFAITERSVADAGPTDLASPTDLAGPTDLASPTDLAGPTDLTRATDVDTAPVCPTPAPAPGNTTRTVQVGSASRSYVLHVPAVYDGSRPVPLVVDFHGIGSSGTAELGSSPYPAVTDAEGVIMAFPDGLKGPAGTGWNLGPCCVADVDDVGFARAVVADVARLACVDRARVYAVGVLTGGGMAYTLACQAADVFAAVAPAAFDMLAENANDCRPSRPISVIAFRGTGVSRVPYGGGASSAVPGMPITFLGAVASFEKWAGLNRCTGSASAEDGNGCASYAGCASAVDVILCTKPGGTEDPGDAKVAWPVLRRHTL